MTGHLLEANQMELEDLEKRITRLERMIYLLIGLQLPNLLPYLSAL